MLALALAATLGAPLALVQVSAASASTYVEVPISAGESTSILADVGGAVVQVVYSTVPVDGFVGVIVEPFDPENYAALPPEATPITVVRSILYDADGVFQEVAGIAVETCVDLTGFGDFDTVDVWEQDPVGADFWSEVPTIAAETNEFCTVGTLADVTYLFSGEADIDVLEDVEIVVNRVDEPDPFFGGFFGEGDLNGSHIQVDVTNNGTELLGFGLGADLRVQGADEKLWLGSTFGIPNDDFLSGIAEIFGSGGPLVSVEPGESATLTVPDWPGKTLTFHSVDLDDPEQSVVLGSFQTGGLFVSLRIDINGNEAEIGSLAEFAGERVFPGATTTVSADGLNPGETYDLWLMPGVDYFAFLILGAVLADNAVKVGEGTVGSDGRLRATFVVPPSVILGDSYQLMVGDPTTRSWPAGTLEQLTIQAPEFTSSAALPTPTERELELALGDFTIAFSFPPGTTSGQTVASLSSTGPAAVGFSLIGDPHAYMHLSTTATFTGLVEVCVRNSDVIDPADLRLYHYVLLGDVYQWVDITTRYEADAVCGETDGFSPFAVGLPDIAVDYTTVEGNPFGFGPTNGTYLSVEITNNGSTAVTVGLGADMMVEGESQPLWRLESWGLDPVEDAELAEGLEFFTRTLEPGDSLTEAVPDFPGKTYSIWQLDVEGSGIDQIIDSYTTEGLFTPLGIDLVEGWFTLGVEATFAGDSVFPGATTTVEAEGLTPGETYELWLTPGADYFSFMFTGAALDEDAVKVGSATVNALGRLATAFTVPVSVQVNDQYQLMIGDPSTRSWPAGTASAITIEAADESSTVDGPVVEQLEVSIPLGDTTVLFSFPAGTTDGQTTASLSSTGPAAVGFTMPTSPPVYLHLSTTAEFEGMVEVCVSVPDGTDPSGLSLYHYDLTSVGYVWIDITTRRTSTAVCGETDSFSPFALGVPDGVRLLTKDQCKNGGWATSTLPTFRNQGLCVMYFVRVR
jgi:hypothetical protein